MLVVREDDLTGQATRELLAVHLAGMHANSPPGHVFALDLSGLQAPNVMVWTAWDGDSIAGIGALKLLGDNAGEVKSMRTHPRHLRKGVAAALLERIIAEAAARGVRQLHLETGRGDAFDPALALYRKRGFTDSGPFAEYEQSAFNRFLQLQL
jgi:putative acetyltransferase